MDASERARHGSIPWGACEMCCNCNSTRDCLLSVDAEADRATGSGAAQVLDSLAQMLDDAPPGRRYDVSLTVTEVDPRERHNDGDYR